MIIGFTGKAGSGKSTAIKFLEECAGERVELVKFAQPLYDLQEQVYSRIESVYQRPKDFVKDRKLLQWLGTDWGRDTIDQDIWIKIWEAKVKTLNPYSIIVCDDVRYDNEAEAIKRMGGTLIQLVSHKSSQLAQGGIVAHKSEDGVSPEYVRFIVDNNDTLDEFRSTIEYLWRYQLAPGYTEAVAKMSAGRN